MNILLFLQTWSFEKKVKEAALLYAQQKSNSILNFSSFLSLSTEPLPISHKAQGLIPPVLAWCWFPVLCQPGQDSWAPSDRARVVLARACSLISETDLNSSSLITFSGVKSWLWGRQHLSLECFQSFEVTFERFVVAVWYCHAFSWKEVSHHTCTLGYVGEQPWEKEAQGGPYCSLHYLKGDCIQVGIGLFSQVKSDRTRRNSI